jgi:hypothetical protein
MHAVLIATPSSPAVTRPTAQFNAYRSVLDPQNILANDWVDAVLGPPLPAKQ